MASIRHAVYNYCATIYHFLEEGTYSTTSAVLTDFLEESEGSFTRVEGGKDISLFVQLESDFNSVGNESSSLGLRHSFNIVDCYMELDKEKINITPFKQLFKS